MRFCFSLVLLLTACSAEQDFVPTPPPAYDFDWRVYNGPSYNEPYVRIDEND